MIFQSWVHPIKFAILTHTKSELEKEVRQVSNTPPPLPQLDCATPGRAEQTSSRDTMIRLEPSLPQLVVDIIFQANGNITSTSDVKIPANRYTDH